MAELNNVLVNGLLVRSSIPLLYSIAKNKSNFKKLWTIKYTGITNIHQIWISDIHWRRNTACLGARIFRAWRFSPFLTLETWGAIQGLKKKNTQKQNIEIFAFPHIGNLRGDRRTEKKEHTKTKQNRRTSIETVSISVIDPRFIYAVK